MINVFFAGRRQNCKKSETQWYILRIYFATSVLIVTVRTRNKYIKHNSMSCVILFTRMCLLECAYEVIRFHHFATTFHGCLWCQSKHNYATYISYQSADNICFFTPHELHQEHVTASRILPQHFVSHSLGSSLLDVVTRRYRISGLPLKLCTTDGRFTLQTHRNPSVYDPETSDMRKVHGVEMGQRLKGVNRDLPMTRRRNATLMKVEDIW